jgi:hypothetical protein
LIIGIIGLSTSESRWWAILMPVRLRTVSREVNGDLSWCSLPRQVFTSAVIDMKLLPPAVSPT